MAFVHGCPCVMRPAQPWHQMALPVDGTLCTLGRCSPQHSTTWGSCTQAWLQDVYGGDAAACGCTLHLAALLLPRGCWCLTAHASCIWKRVQTRPCRQRASTGCWCIICCGEGPSCCVYGAHRCVHVLGSVYGCLGLQGLALLMSSL
jgi:hypothetical protein